MMSGKSSKSTNAKANANVAAHNASVAQSSVNERRLRPIYDWLDNGNNKKALQEADKVLKKQPHFPCCKVLKSLALIRMMREEEAQTLLDAVLEECPTDDSTLQAMSIAFRELQQPEKICLLYENAIKKEPTNEELLSHLFVSYVRMGNYKRQQQIAMSLYKVKPKTPYYFWAVMSILLQAASSGDEKLAKSITLPLAERMMSVMEKEKKIKQEQDTRLYLIVLEMQHKFSDALAFLNGPLGKQLEEQTSHLDLVENKKIDYLKKLDQWDQVYTLSLQLLERSEDHWNLYLDFITSVFRLIDAGGDHEVSVKKALDFIIEQQQKFPKNRGPFLAQIEVQMRLVARSGGADPELEAELVRQLISYFEKFSSKLACGFDLKLYLPSLSKSAVQTFFDEALKKIDFDESNRRPNDIFNLHQHVCWHQLRRLCGYHHDPTLDEAGKMAIVDELCRLFVDTSDLVDNYSTTEIRPNDGYVVLAAHLLWQLWTETAVDKYFWQAVVFLQAALKKSPFDYHIRFLLIKFFNQIAAVGVSHSVYIGLELKHIQLDSLGHVLTRHVPTSGHFNTQSKIFGNTLKFFTSNYKDTVDYIISAYRCGTFDKIVEFIKLRDRLSASQHYTTITVERMLLDLLVEASTHAQTVQMMSYLEVDPDKDEINWSDLTDNRDFRAMHSWDPSDRCVTDELISESFVLDQKFLRFRSLLLRSLAASVYMSEDIHPARMMSSSSSTASEANHKENGNAAETRLVQISSVIGRLIDQLVKHNEEVQLEVQSHQDFRKFLNPVQGPDRSRLICYYLDRHPELLVELLRLVLTVQGLVACQPETRADLQITAVKSCSNLEDQFGAIVSKVGEKVEAETNLLFREVQFEMIVNAMESVSFACIVFGVCQSLMNRPRGPGGKKNKKKIEYSPDLADFVTAFNALITSFKTSLTTLLKISSDLEKLISLDPLEVKFSDLKVSSATKDPILPSGDEVQDELVKLMESSYSLSMAQLKAVVQNKVNYLEHLVL